MPTPPPTVWQQEERKIYLRDIFFLVAIVFVSIGIAEQFLLSLNATLVDRIFTYLLLFVPLGTINFIGHYYYRNRRIRQTGNLRSSLRYRLSIAFMLIAIIPSIPIFLISAENVETAVVSMFNVDVVRAMDAAHMGLRHAEAEAAARLYDDVRRGAPDITIAGGDPGAEVARLLGSGVLNPERDFAGVVTGERVITASSNILRGQPLPDFREDIGKRAPYAVKRLRGIDYMFFRFEVDPDRDSQGQLLPRAILVGRKLHPGLEADLSQFDRVQKSFREENFWKQRVPGTLRLGLALLYMFMICAALVLALVLARQIAHPIVSLAAATRAVADGDLDTRINLEAVGELGILIDSFNQMTAELMSLRERLLHSQRLAAWQEVARRLAHEIKNPLTPIQLSADRMMRRLDHPEKGDLNRVVRTGCKTIIEQVTVLKELVEEFANFARLPQARLVPASLDAIVSEAVNGFQAVVPGIPIEMRLAGNLPEIPLDKTIIIGMTNNLVKNAVEAIAGQSPEQRRPGPQRVIISTAFVRQGARRYVRLRIEDTGPGIDYAMRDRIFEPYYSTKPEGSGLGLSIVERAAFEHDARLQVDRSPLGGAGFTILFRIEDQERHQ